MNFFKSFLSSCLGSLVAFIVLIFLVFSFFAAAVSSLSSGDTQVVVEDNSVLHLKLDVPLNEMEADNPLEGLPILGAMDSPIGFLKLKNVIQHAAGDAKIKGI
ncbi:MAG: hypothetical protein ORN54_12860 [Cyclobacteriaceae bacterium]|nr:hypothetical protein [Cyclobacteriaceae bacterium]